jgi:hypothetical protein
MRLTSLLPVVAALIAAIRADAQPAQPLRGVVFDSLANAPLAEATVRVVGASAFAKTDSTGRFRFDRVMAGAVELAVEHPMLDSIGLYELTSRVNHDGQREHTLGVPSFATISRAICGRALPRDSAVVFGTVRNPESQVAGNADVVISWVAVARTTDGKLGSRRLSYRTHTDALGRYAACGLPTDEPYAFRASGGGSDSLAALAIELPARRTSILQQDLMLAAPLAAVPADSTRDASTVRTTSTGPTGVLRGTVVGQGGEPVANTRVSIADVADVRTDADGRFLLLDVPTGSRNIEALAVGRTPATQLIAVKARDTTTVTFVLERVTALKAVRTEATVLSEFTRNFEERKKTGIGKFRDSTDLDSSPSMVAALSAIPSVTARTGRGGIPLVQLPKIASITGGVGLCVARLYVDGRPEQWERVAGMVPREIAWMEVYARASMVPAEFQVTTNGDACGAVSIVTKARVGR